MRIVDWLRGRVGRGTEPTGLPPETGAPRPGKCAGNPGEAVEGRVTLTNAERTWTESFHLIRLAARVLRDHGHEVVEHETWLDLPSSGFALQPLLVALHPLEAGGVQTTTTIDVRHANLIPDGLFEYQHSTGDNVEDALAKGFASWEQIDLSVLIDALQEDPKTCSAMSMTFPAKEGAPVRTRRAVLGGVAYYIHTTAAPAVEQAAAGTEPPVIRS